MKMVMWQTYAVSKIKNEEKKNFPGLETVQETVVESINNNC